MALSDEVDRVRALMGAMREYGATDLRIGDTRIVLTAAATPSRVGHTTSPVDDEEDDVAKEISEEERAEAAWNQHWSRMLRSSGSPIPKFPGLERYKSLMNS